jgi:hypothetical protein
MNDKIDKINQALMEYHLRVIEIEQGTPPLSISIGEKFLTAKLNLANKLLEITNDTKSI